MGTMNLVQQDNLPLIIGYGSGFCSNFYTPLIKNIITSKARAWLSNAILKFLAMQNSSFLHDTKKNNPKNEDELKNEK